VVVHNNLAASVGVTASWNAGYVAFVRVTNTGSTAHSWSVTVTHQGQDGLRLGSVWGAAGTQRGTSLVFTGGPLPIGGSVTFGYQTSKTGQADARPSGCTVVGGTCGVR
jgi:cellulase/cellobiase CelA1